MKEKINIAEILKDKPEGMKLWTDMFGSVTLYCVTDACDAFQVKHHHNKEPWFDENGKMCKEGVLCIYPSKSMRDWSKFAWKKGDVLVSNDGKREVLFKTWENDSYTKFVGFHCLITNDNEEVEYDNGTTVFNTNDFKGTEAEDAAQTYINTIEERLGGKLNLATLEVEKHQTEFKDGDIVVYGKSVAICRKIYEHTLYFYVSIDETFGLLFDDNCASSEGYRFATDSEKQQLFDALAKVGKAWDAEKKQIVYLNTNIDELKPFDKVLIKDNILGSWKPALFWKKVDVKGLYPYMIIGGKRYRFCVPYKGNEHLLDTTNNVDG